MTLNALKKAAHLQGCMVFDYSRAKTTLIAIGLYERADHTLGLTYVDNLGDNLIFIDDRLSEEQQTFVLAHELGHIHLKHGKAKNLKEQRMQEQEADSFAVAVTGHYKSDLFPLSEVS